MSDLEHACADDLRRWCGWLDRAREQGWDEPTALRLVWARWLWREHVRPPVTGRRVIGRRSLADNPLYVVCMAMRRAQWPPVEEDSC